MEHISALLLLPPAPNPPSADAVRAAYRPPLLAALRRFSPRAPPSATIDIALPCPGYSFEGGPWSFSRCRPSQLQDIQDLLVQTYSLVSSLCDEQQISTTKEDGIDIRVILLGYDPKFDYAFLQWPGRRIASCLVDLPILALSDRNWTHLLVVDGEPGERLHRQFMIIVNSVLSARVGGTWVTERLFGGITLKILESQASELLLSAEPAGKSDPPPIRHRIVVTQQDKQLNLAARLRLTVALLLAEYYGYTDEKSVANSEECVGAACLDPQPELVQFLRTIIDWQLVSHHTSPFGDPESLVRLDPGVAGISHILPWGVIYVTDLSHLNSLLVNHGTVEYTILFDESQKEQVKFFKPCPDDGKPLKLLYL